MQGTDPIAAILVFKMYSDLPLGELEWSARMYGATRLALIIDVLGETLPRICLPRITQDMRNNWAVRPRGCKNQPHRLHRLPLVSPAAQRFRFGRIKAFAAELNRVGVPAGYNLTPVREEQSVAPGTAA